MLVCCFLQVKPGPRLIKAMVPSKTILALLDIQMLYKKHHGQKHLNNDVNWSNTKKTEDYSNFI
uniref:Uncharacterized protein n=1 Tax=Octopus bimaculoides TaxID=37653 RepID=A0A0L8FG43_OCTBM